MRIDLHTRTSEPTESTASKSGSQKVRSKATAGPGLEDATRVSLDGDRLRKLEAVANAAPEIRSDRVKTLSQALGRGDHQVKAEDTADAMLSDKLARSALFR
jgi:flagellar biosynthesis anti-sigma factor FlgM